MSLVTPSKPRETVLVTFPEDRIYEAPNGTPLLAFIQQMEQDTQPTTEGRAIAAMIDNRLRELTHPVTSDIAVRPISLLDVDGVRIYRRSLSFLLIAAAHECFPEANVFIDHALPQRAYSCHVEGRPNFTPDELQTIRQKMRDLVDADLPIERAELSLDEARRYFGERNDEEKVRLLQFRSRSYLRIYTLQDFSDYFFGYMVPSTGYLQWFDLESTESGFLLRYPDEKKPNIILSIQKLGQLDKVFQQSGEWLKLLNVRDIGQLNEANHHGHMRELILIAEALHERRIAEIGQKIAQRVKDGVRLVLISGPSSSGKTTFSKRLAVQLMTHGLKTFTLELDNYFVDREKTPRDAVTGDYDFESLNAINVDLLNQQAHELIAGEEVVLPRFDFKAGISVAGRTIQLAPAQVIIMEGIHGLNPELTPSIDRDQTYRIYVSALTQLNIDRYNRVSTTDVRLLRRIVRDATHRGWTATDTLARWESVGRGERENIFPFQELADEMFNSALVYELAALRPFAEPHLLRVSQNHPKWAEANRLLSFLAWVQDTSDEGIPDNSILREFIGGSNLRDYHPGA